MMQRLTIRNSDGSVSQPTYEGNGYWQKVLNRLAAYEDTGMEPEEVAHMKRTHEEIRAFLRRVNGEAGK